MMKVRGLAVLAAVASVMLAACSNAPVIPAPSEVPLGKDTLALLAKKGMQPSAPIFVRIYKEESELELWKQRDDGRFYHFKTYPICNWSGELGPKLNYGDRQAPEGFYTINAGLMNPNSKFYLSFNLGYPNAFDKAWGRTGDSVMVHGKCRSAGCYAMTDALMEEIYSLARESLTAGQQNFQVHAYPFRMTDARMAEVKKQKNKWYPFWSVLKQGYDHFEQYRVPPNVAICEKRYVVNVVAPQSRINASEQCPAFQKPVISAFTPLPEGSDVQVAQGQKLKGLVNPDNDPTLAQIQAAKKTSSVTGAVPPPAGAGAKALPVANAQ